MKRSKEHRAISATVKPFAEQDLSDIVREVHERTESPKSHRGPDVKSEPYEHTRTYQKPKQHYVH